MKTSILLSVLVIAGLVFLTASVAAEAPPGGTGYITFTGNINGAQVFLDGNFVGTASGSSFDIQSGADSGTYTITKDGYYDATGSYDFVPGGEANIEIPVSLQLKPVGSGTGYFIIHSNVDGATVYVDGAQKGTISNGILTFSVSTTATPFRYYSVSKTGYQTYTSAITSMPSDGQYLDLYATLNPVTTVPTTIATTAPTPVPTTIGGDIGWYLVHGNVDGAAVYFDDTYKGIVSNGILNVQVYTTGTPYSRYRVEKAGYETASGMLPPTPAKGATRDVFVTLSSIVQPTATITGVIGGDQGWYVVHSNVDGATVLFGNDIKGITASGTLTVPDYSTGTPYTTFTVKKTGYTTYTGTIASVPGKGESVDLYATLNPAVTTTPTSEPTKSSLPVGITGLAVLVGGMCMIILSRKS